MGTCDHQTERGAQATSRRSFLRSTALATVASAGALGLGGAAAQAAPRAAPALADLELPADAALTLRMFRSLTLLAIAATIKEPSFAKAVEAAALKELGRQVGGLGRVGGGAAAWEPGDDICPPWWPWPFPWPPRRFDEIFTPPDLPAIPTAGRAAIDMFQTLALYNMAFEYKAAGMGAEVQKLAVEELNAQYVSLAQGGSLAGYDDGDGICPDWWPFPWPRPGGGTPGIPAPEASVVLLDLLRSLIHHNVALRLADAGSQQRGAALARQQIGALSKALGGFAGGAAAWEPGDDICPPHWRWPWPWPGPRPIRDILDPARRGDPDPEPNRGIRATLDIFRCATVFAIAATIDDQALALDLQRQAIGHVQDQAQQL